MRKRQVVNIINFIRAVEPREPVDLIEPVREQIRLMKELNLRGTFLVQYDTLLNPAFTEMLKALDPAQFELGVWFEVVQPQAEKAGIPWTGRWSWDWHVHCGFSMGYTPEQREMLVDILYDEFRNVFGYYPRVFGSWFFDTPTVRHIADKYGVDALCNCKEQFGTDGYTLWGGYYGQGYYPSRTNVFMPAQNEAEQLPVPLFRMLGSDPVYQYDCGLSLDDGAKELQGVITLEPVYLPHNGDSGSGGGDPHWVDWFVKENYNGDCLSFGYAQAGQENSFSWPKMKDGLEYQFPLFARLQAEGQLTVEPLGDTGRWFKQTYATTPASAIAAHSAYDDPDKDSVWYNSKYYRANLYFHDGAFRLRDLHIFRETFPDPFETAVCPDNCATYETLPVVDGNLHTGNGVLSGLYVLDAATGQPLTCAKPRFSDLGCGGALVDYGSLRVTLLEDRIKFCADEAFVLEHRFGRSDRHFPAVVSCTRDRLALQYEGADYALTLAPGRFEDGHRICSKDGIVELILG